MINPGPIAQGRALTRLVGEQRNHYRRIYIGAPTDLPTRRRQGWAQRQLSFEFAERYRAIYEEEVAKLQTLGDGLAIDPAVVGRSSGSGPTHAVLVGHANTACGRIRFHTYPANTADGVTCGSCVDEMRDQRSRQVDPQFRANAAEAESRIAELADLQRRTAAVREAVIEALSKLRTPPGGTDERSVFAELLAGAVDCGLKLRDIGAPLGVSGERVRQIVADLRGGGTQ